MNGSVLVTGGAGYVGSHIVLALLESGYQPVVIDSIVTGDRTLVPAGVPMVEADMRDIGALGATIASYKPTSIIHCAASLLVEESVRFPLAYYRNNVGGAWAICDVASIYGIKEVILSSTATVYGEPTRSPIPENLPLLPVNPYAASKAMAERALTDMAAVHGFNFTPLRYFNVAGADPKGRSGQPQKAATHLVTAAVEYALGIRPSFKIYGTDYPTRDGTAERDYVHVSDVAQAHVDVLDAMRAGLRPGPLNVGYGRGSTVLEVLEAVRFATGNPLADIERVERRPGDVASLVADSSKIRSLIGWTPRYDDLKLIAAHAASWAERRAGVVR